jgi:hypothetical protein
MDAPDEVFYMNVESESKDNGLPKDDPVMEHIADYIIQTLIREDVNAFNESKLMSDLLVMRLPEVAAPLMYKTVKEAVDRVKKEKTINLIKEIGGITTQRRLHFRSKDQYNSFIMLFFQAIEDHPELLESIGSEEDFEKLMIYCIHEFRETLEKFAVDIAGERTALEHKHKLYIHRRNGPAVDEVPTYADFVAERIGYIAK